MSESSPHSEDTPIVLQPDDYIYHYEGAQGGALGRVDTFQRSSSHFQYNTPFLQAERIYRMPQGMHATQRYGPV